jgi:hypothetical protein
MRSGVSDRFEDVAAWRNPDDSSFGTVDVEDMSLRGSSTRQYADNTVVLCQIKFFFTRVIGSWTHLRQA